jgi:hypothetical protein
MDSLGIRNNKRVLAASVFGDVSGFTAYIDNAAAESNAKAALRVIFELRRAQAKPANRVMRALKIGFALLQQQPLWVLAPIVLKYGRQMRTKCG